MTTHQAKDHILIMSEQGFKSLGSTLAPSAQPENRLALKAIGLNPLIFATGLVYRVFK
jgi:hypothetical protein